MRSLLLSFSLLFVLFSISSCSSSKKVAKEEAVKSPVGTWAGMVAGTPMGDLPIELVLNQEGDSYSGAINSEAVSTKLSEVKIVDNKITGSFYSADYGQDIYFDAQYNPDSDTVEGWFMDEFKFTGKRKEADQ